MSDNPPRPRLTSLSHGGGCGCKIAPGVLATLIERSAPHHAVRATARRRGNGGRCRRLCVSTTSRP